jgi:hypothetical protein
MLVLSITILAAVLVTGTVVNIVSAANTLNGQQKTNQHPVTSKGSPYTIPLAGQKTVNGQRNTNQRNVTHIGSPRIVSSAAHGSDKVQLDPNQHVIRIGGWTCNVYNVQHISCTNQHNVTKPVRIQQPGTKFGGQCYIVELVDGTFTVPPYPVRVDMDCFSFFKNMYIHQSSDGYRFEYGGQLIGCWGQEWNTFTVGCDAMYGIDNAPIEIKVQQGRPAHAWYAPPATKTPPDESTFSGAFSLCDEEKYSDHSAYLTAYFAGGKVPSVHNPPYPGPYMGEQSTGAANMPWFTLKVCNGPLPPPPPPPGPTPTDFTSMHVQYYPSQGYQFPFSGKLEASVGGVKHGLEEASLKYSFRYLDDTSSHPHPFTMGHIGGQKTHIDYYTVGGGGFSGIIPVCDDPKYNTTTYNQDAEFNVNYPGGNHPASPDAPYSGATSSNMKFHVKICPPPEGQHTTLSYSAAHK